MKEEEIEFKDEKIFFNPNMQFCRSISSIGFGAIKKDLDFVDGFSASGIRGIRYKKENSNAKKAYFIDANPRAVKIIKKNLKINKIKGDVFEDDFNRSIREIRADFIEIDPFGSPTPYLYDSIRSIKNKKESYLSITATDVMVLCGPHSDACLKNYYSYSLNNEFTHENGLRILLQRIARDLGTFNLGMQPLFSLSDQHYFKVLLKIKRGKGVSKKTVENIGYVSHCEKCGNRWYEIYPVNFCEFCKKFMSFTGPLWIGKLHDKKHLDRMKKLNEKRDYKDKKKIAKILDLMVGEIGYPPYFFNLHKIAKLRKKNRIIPIDKAIEKINKSVDLKFKGKLSAARTHFNPVSIKTNASIEDIMRILYP